MIQQNQPHRDVAGAGSSTPQVSGIADPGYVTTTGRSRQPFSRAQRLSVVYGMLCFMLVLVVCQLWLVTATVNAFLGGDDSIVLAAAIASAVCLALNAGLLRYLYSLERTRR